MRADALLRAVTQNMHVAYAVVDATCRVLEAGGAVALLGGDAGEATLVGRAVTDLIPELVGNEAAVIDVCTGRLPRFELALINREGADGTTRYLTVVLLSAETTAGEADGAIVLALDVTGPGQIGQQLAQHRNELDLARRALEAANVELRRGSELKSHFVSVAAHELRSPLTAILGYLEMLLDGEYGPLNDGQRQALDAVNLSTQRLLAVTRDLLDVTRIEAGRIDLQLVLTDLGSVVRQVAAQFRPQFQAKGQIFRVDVASNLPLALCDAARTAQVLANLLGNAMTYTPVSGHIAVDVCFAKEPGFLQVAVADDGVGIAAEEQAHVFSRFYRAATARQMSANGAGLGLYIAREIVELQGGRIWLESQAGEGTRVSFTVPMM